MSDSTRGYDPPLAERVVGVIGLVLVFMVLAYLTYRAFTGGDRPPDVAVVVQRIEPNGADYVVLFRATNAGEETAAQVIVEGVLRRDGRVIERARALLDYVPSRSTTEGGLFFVQDPRENELELRASGYEKP